MNLHCKLVIIGLIAFVFGFPPVGTALAEEEDNGASLDSFLPSMDVDIEEDGSCCFGDLYLEECEVETSRIGVGTILPIPTHLRGTHFMRAKKKLPPFATSEHGARFLEKVRISDWQRANLKGLSTSYFDTLFQILDSRNFAGPDILVKEWYVQLLEDRLQFASSRVLNPLQRKLFEDLPWFCYSSAVWDLGYEPRKDFFVQWRTLRHLRRDRQRRPEEEKELTFGLR